MQPRKTMIRGSYVRLCNRIYLEKTKKGFPTEIREAGMPPKYGVHVYVCVYHVPVLTCVFLVLTT